MKKAQQFLNRKREEFSKVLLGLSGGPDSIALFSLLLESKINFDVAHIDHGLRSDSLQESLDLKKIVEDKKISFHYKRIDLTSSDCNIEMIAREERLAFFSQLYKEYGYTALFLAHHQDDLSETVLKRILEGSSILNLSGIRQVQNLRQMVVVRPFLMQTKNEIYQYLERRKLNYFIDPTNFTKGNLRSKMREDIIPYLENAFGKNIMDSLANIAREHQWLKKNVQKRIGFLMQEAISGPWGSFIELDRAMDRFDLAMLIRFMANDRALMLTRMHVEILIEMYEEEKVGKQVNIGKTIWTIERSILFIYKSDCDFKIKFVPNAPKVTWKNLWKHPIQSICESNQLEAPKLYMRHKSGSILKDWYSQHKIPIFLRKKVVVKVEDCIVKEEFLTNSSFDLNR